MKTIIIVWMLLIVSICSADQKYNQWTGQYETVPQDSELKWNPWTNKYSYQPKDAKIEWNPWNNKYEWDSGRGN